LDVGLADPGNKPLSPAKVKRSARMTAARQRGRQCEKDHIVARDGGEMPLGVASIEPEGCGVLDGLLLRAVMSGPEAGCMRESVIG